MQDRPRRSLRLLNELRCTPMEVDEAVDHGGGGDVVAEDLSPAAERLVARDDQACPLVPG